MTKRKKTLEDFRKELSNDPEMIQITCIVEQELL